MQKASGPHHRFAFRDNYLAAIGIAVFLLASLMGNAQIITRQTNFGIGPHRVLPDSTLYVPTGCGIPTDSTFLFSQGFAGKGEKVKQAAKYYDSCGHHEYIWDPSLRLWHVSDSSSGGSTDTSHLSSRIDSRVVNLGGAIGLFVGPELSRPAPGTPGRQYTSSDSGRIWLDIGVDWLLLSGSGSSITTYVNTTISGIRAATTASTAIGYSLTDVGAEGSFMFIPTDHSTPDDTWRTLVDAAGHRYRRAFTGPAHFSWFQPAINSTSDQSALVLQAIHQAGHSAYGIIFDSGVYYCKNMFDSDANYLHIEGPGTLKNHSSAAFGTYLLTIRNCKNVSISGLHFDGNYPIVAGSPTGGTGMIALDRDTGMVIRDVYFANNGYACINSYDCKNVLVDNMNTYMTDCGFQTLGNCENITVENSTFLYGTSAGVDFFGRSGANILYDRNCRARNNRAVGKNPGVEFRFVDGFLIDGNFTDSCQNGIAGGNINTFGPSHDSRFTNPRNGIITNNIDSNSINASIVGPCTHCKVNGNMSYQAGGFGIEFGNATDSSWKTTIDNNTILNWGRRIPACAAIRILNNFKGSLKNNMLISDSNNTCMDIQHSDSLWVESNIAQSLANYQWVASSSTNIFGFNNSGKWHGPFQGVLTYGSYNYGFSSDTTGRATDTTNYKIWVYNPTTGKWGYFSNWQNLVGQNIIRPSPTFPNRLYASSISDSLLFGYTSTGTPIGTFNVTGLSDFKGGIQGTWSETITANKSYNRQVDATFNGGTTFNAHSFTYNINAASIGNNSPNGLPLFMTDNANSGSNTVNGFYSLFTKNGTGAGSDIHHNTSTTVNSGFTLSQDIGYNYAPPVGAGNTTQSIGFIMNGSSSSTLSKYDGYVVQNSTAANAIVNGINSALDGSAGHRLIYSAGMAPSYHAGLVNIGTDSTLNSSALLNLTSTSKGVLLTRMNTAQMLAIPTPATYLVIFNTDSVAVGRPICYYTGSAWKSIGGSAGSSSSSLRIGPKDSAAANANGATAVGSNLYMQTATTNFPGMLDTAGKRVLDSLKARLFPFSVNLVNIGSGGIQTDYNSPDGKTFNSRNDSAGLWGKVDTTADGKVRIGVDSGAMMPVLRTAFAPIGSGGALPFKSIAFGNGSNGVAGDTTKIKHDSSTNGHTYLYVNTGRTTRYVDYFYGNSEFAGYQLPAVTDAAPYQIAYRMGDSCVNLAIAGRTLQNTGWAGATGFILGDTTTLPTYGATSKFLFNAIGVNDVRYVNASFDSATFRTAYRLWVIAAIRKGWPPSRIILLSPFYVPNLTYKNDSIAYSFTAAATQARSVGFGVSVQAVVSEFGLKFVNGYNAVYNAGADKVIQSDSLHMAQYADRAVTSAVLSVVDTIRMVDQRLAVDGLTTLNDLRLKATPVISSSDNSYPLGQDSTGKVGMIQNANFSKVMVGGAKFNDDIANLIVSGRARASAFYATGYVPVPTAGSGLYLSRFPTGDDVIIAGRNWGASSNSRLALWGYGGQVAVGTNGFTTDGASLYSPGFANLGGMFVTGSASPTTGAGILFKYTGGAGYIYATDVGVAAHSIFLGFGGSRINIGGSSDDGVHSLQVPGSTKLTGIVGVATSASATANLFIGASTSLISALRLTSAAPPTAMLGGNINYSNGLYIADSSASVRDTFATRSVTRSMITATLAAVTGTPYSVLQKYSANLGSTYDSRTFVDKNYADSMAAAKIAAAVDGGQYTPTVTNITNASSVSGVNSFYSVTNKRVSAEVVCDIITTSANTLTTVEVSLPIASPSLSGGGSITGHGMVYVSGSGTAGNWIPCEIEINASGHDAALVFLCGAAAGYIAKFTISYMAP